jgi:hypothetical protein
MRDALRPSFGNPFAALPRVRRVGRVAVQTARLSAAEFDGTIDGAEPEGTRGRRSRPIVLADIDLRSIQTEDWKY